MKAISQRTLFLFATMAVFACNPSSNNNKAYKGMIVHTVILDLKEDISEADRTYFINELKSLSKIPETIDLFVASYTLTNDERAKTDYDVILEMKFNSENDLYTYANHPYHLEVRSKIKDFLARKPVVYDMKIE